jgi:hypothetical protein
MTALVLATFGDEGAYLRARVRLIADERRIVGEWMPYAADVLGEGEGTRHIRLVTILAGVVGAILLFSLETWSAVRAYPLNAGGRPLFSWPAFVPSAVEFGALLAAIGGTAAFFRNARLTRLHAPAFEFAEIARASQGAFVVAVACDAGMEANAVVALLGGAGAEHSRVVTS